MATRTSCTSIPTSWGQETTTPTQVSCRRHHRQLGLAARKETTSRHRTSGRRRWRSMLVWGLGRKKSTLRRVNSALCTRLRSRCETSRTLCFSPTLRDTGPKWTHRIRDQATTRSKETWFRRMNSIGLGLWWLDHSVIFREQSPSLIHICLLLSRPEIFHRDLLHSLVISLRQQRLLTNCL